MVRQYASTTQIFRENIQILTVPPISDFGSVIEIIKVFGYKGDLFGKEVQLIFYLLLKNLKKDEGVLPTEKEIKKFRIKLVKLVNTTHSEMDDNANNEQRKEIQNYILAFLN